MISPLAIERMMIPCPVVDCGDYEKYPPASDSELSEMKSVYWCVPRDAVIYINVCVNKGQAPYVDVYVWDSMLCDKSYERFIICEGMCLPEDLEKKLIEYSRYRNLYISDKNKAALSYDIVRYFPRWNYDEHIFADIGEALEYIYFVSHSGPREILYKAGLCNIGAYLDQYETYNVIGTTPQSIIGHDVPLKLLRILNQPSYTDYFLDEEFLERAVMVYSHYSGYIGKTYPSLGQWLYLDGLFFRGMVAKDEFSRPLYNYLESIDKCWVASKAIVDKYFCFLEMRESMDLVSKIKIPEPGSLEKALRRLETIRENRKYDRLYRIRARRDAAWYEYSDENYIVVFPKTPDDIFMEALALRNCLDNYYERHANCQTTIVFLRKKEEPDKPYVAMEVASGRIIQVRAACNMQPEPPVIDFVIKYAKEKNLYYNHDELDILFAV